MGDKHSGDAGFFLDLPDLFTGLEPQAGVQVRKGLVQKKDSGELHQSTGDSHALLLAAG